MPMPPLTRARIFVREIANGKTINGAYRLPPGEALEAFKADLILILDALEPKP